MATQNSVEKTNSVQHQSPEEAADYADRVLQDFENMKQEYMQTIDILGATVRRTFSQNLGADVDRTLREIEVGIEHPSAVGATTGSSTARAEADCKEFFEDEETLNQKIKQLADLIRNSKHFCAFTGAGISTAAGIADFRSGINTALDTGAGKWAAQAARKQGKTDKEIKKNKRPKSSIKAIPTASHMALVSLTTSGPKYLKCLISQNTDGLHRRSGIPVHQLCELHGNTTLEVCDKCGKEYMRDYRARGSMRRIKQSVHDHKTGRKCTVPKCGGNLEDTIINFNEPLPTRIFQTALQHTEECDVMLALGSSLTVTPAADMPFDVGYKWNQQIKHGQKPTNHLVIVNLQKTPLDKVCSLRIFAKIDDVMVPLMKELGLEIPEYKLNRYMRVRVEPIGNRADLKKLEIAAVDVDGINATVFDKVNLMHNGKSIKQLTGYSRKVQGTDDEFRFQIKSKMLESTNNDHEQKESENGSNPSNGLVANLSSRLLRRLNVSNSSNPSNGLAAELSFFGNFGEPQLLIPLQPFLDDATSSTNGNKDDETLEFMCRMEMDIKSKSWNVEPYSCPPYKPTINHIGRMAAMAKSTKPKKPKTKSQEEREQREAQRAARDAQRTKERMALKAKRMEERKREQLLKANNEPVAEPAAESKDDDSNHFNGNQPQDAAAAPLVLDNIEAPNAVEANPEDDTEISPVHRRPSDDKSPSPYRSHLSENETVSASNDADLVSGDQ